MQEGQDIIPLRFNWHGYYRARYNWIGNVPLGPTQAQQEFPRGKAYFGTMRLRLDPEVTYGPNEDLPIARLRFTLDGFDNVVWGDNARVFNVPLFSTDQSITNIDGFDLRDSIKLERAWIEFLVPVGQIRVGRQESGWGVGLLTHAGNGLAEWGDFERGETFDRITFVTRPITVGRAIASGDTRQTPLIYAFVYDRLTQNPVGPSVELRPAVAVDYQFQPFVSTLPDRPGTTINQIVAPYTFLATREQQVNEIVNVLAWFDEDWGVRETDELFVGVYIVYRWQNSTQSKITIPDFAWRLQRTIGNRGIAITTEGEYYTIIGESGALPFTGGCPPTGTVGPCNVGDSGIHNVLGRIGATRPGKWSARLESGYSRGDDNLLDTNLTVRAFNTNIKVGLLMYQVALDAVGFNGLQTLNAVELGPNGSVWNSKYFYPQARFTIVPGLEVHGTFLVAWANSLDSLVYRATKSRCGFKGECFMGWEADVAIRARIGQDIVWIDWESGIMQPGDAFTNAGMSDKVLWTTQMRAAMVF